MTPLAHMFVVTRQISLVVSSMAANSRRSEDVIDGIWSIILEVCVVAHSLKIGKAHCDASTPDVTVLGTMVEYNRYGVSMTRSCVCASFA